MLCPGLVFPEDIQNLETIQQSTTKTSDRHKLLREFLCAHEKNWKRLELIDNKWNKLPKEMMESLFQ